MVSVDEGVAEVELGMHLECKRCGACMVALSSKERKLKVLNEIGALVGQKVEIEVKPKVAIGAAFLVFVLPVLAMLGGGVAGYRLGQSLGLPAEISGVCLGGLTLVLSFLLLRHVEMGGSTEGIARIVRLGTAEDSREGGY